MAKLKAGEVAVKVTRRRSRSSAANGYTRSTRWSGCTGTRRSTPLEGTSEIQRLVISAAISGMRIR